MELRYTRKLIKLGKSSKAIVLPSRILKKYPELKEVIIEEFPDKLIIKFEMEVKKDGSQ